MDEIIAVELLGGVLRGKFACCLIAGEMNDERSIAVRGKNFLGIFPARQIKLTPAESKVRDAAQRQFLLQMFADKTRAASDENFHLRQSV